uniref:Ribonuclease H-like domain-containing protein n=1 Tax=Tanacetum cinerariifolium TaxID=118510 RepID=A0A6L2MJF1_TANCI|nr:ribonuclease H-like domain-containing protein [Tanacetum cinerariifolium]
MSYHLFDIYQNIESRKELWDFLEAKYMAEDASSIPIGTEDIGGSMVLEEVTKEVVQQLKPELRKSKRNRTPKDFRPEFQLYLIEGTRDEVLLFLYSLQETIQLLVSTRQWLFLTAIASSRFPSTNNQLRTSSNPRNQATIQDGKVIVQQVQGRQCLSYFGTGYKSNATSFRGNNVSGQTRVVKCYNCQDKAMLVEAHKAGQILDEEQLAFLIDLGVPDGQAVQTIISKYAVFQTEDHDTYDSDCDDISNAKAILMANISNYGSDVISEIPHSETYLNDMENQSTDLEKITKKWPKPNKNEHEIVKNAQKPDPKIVLVDQKWVKKIRIRRLLSNKPIDYVKLNKIYEDFGKRFVPQQKLLADEAFWFTSANVMPPKKTTSHSVETQKPELKVYSGKPINVKNVGSSKKAKIVESKNANHSEPNHTWGSNATNILSSSSLVMTGTVRFENDHIARIVSMRIRKKQEILSSTKAKDTNQEKLYLLHMDLCGSMHVAIINGKNYILAIVDDYSRFTWVRFLRSKDEAPEAIIKCIKNIQVPLNAIVRNVRTDNEAEFINRTLCEFYENVGISHQTSVACTPQQNGVVERRNRTLV